MYFTDAFLCLSIIAVHPYHKKACETMEHRIKVTLDSYIYLPDYTSHGDDMVLSGILGMSGNQAHGQTVDTRFFS